VGGNQDVPTRTQEMQGHTSGADVLRSTSKNNYMYGQGGNDTYTHFVRGNSGKDIIVDSGGKDKLVLTNYKLSE
jgi:Ca2+-binding RTX toxin-like protein